MKTGFLDRVLIYLFSLIAACLAVLAALRAFGLDLVETFFEGLSAATPVIIHEAVELASRFSSEKAGPFVNGILGSISRSGKI